MYRLCSRPVISKKSIETAGACLFSSKSSNKLKKRGDCLSSEEDKSTGDEKDEIVFKEINLLGPADARTPLPGNVGPVRPEHEDPSLSVNNKTVSLTKDWRGQRHSAGLQMRKINIALGTPKQSNEKARIKNVTLDIVAQKCPHLVGIDFQEMFPHRAVGKNVTLITFSKKKKKKDITTQADISYTKSAVNNKQISPIDDWYEKEMLVQDYIQFAGLLCGKLRENGFWADFINPSLDWRQLRHQSSPNILEVDVRYRKLGLSIEDTGLCKVVSHDNWDSSPHVGSLFTNAAIDNPKLVQILEPFKST